ncbi:MAG: hypothetical protein AB1547_07825, partial [Thermodesulfobacteriota bacterium]
MSRTEEAVVIALSVCNYIPKLGLMESQKVGKSCHRRMAGHTPFSLQRINPSARARKGRALGQSLPCSGPAIDKIGVAATFCGAILNKKYYF